MSLGKIIADLRKFANHLEEEQRTLSLVSGATIRVALAKVREHVSDGTMTVEVYWNEDRGQPATVSFTVWDGKNFHRGNTLDEAVGLTVAALAPKQTVDALDRVLPADVEPVAAKF